MKFIQPAEITAEYKITTPMFLGGAFPEESVDDQQFRNASLKGALRFWWRALNWGRMLREAGGNETAALKALHRREGELFGKASDGKDSVQSRVQLSSQFLEVTTLAAGDKSVKPVSYLLGMGLYDYRGGTLRPALRGGVLRLTARFKPGSGQDVQDEVQQTLIALGIFGGLGSRGRKGLGSLAVQSLQRVGERQEFTGPAQLHNFIASLDYSAPGKDAPLTAFTASSRIDLAPAGNSPTECLKLVSDCLQLYRDGTVNGEREKPTRFDQDRTRAEQAANGKAISQLPDRAVFGLPHNYHWKSPSPFDDLQIAPKGTTLNRRASPLFIHVHQFPNGQCCILHALLPGLFLPLGTSIELKGRRTTTLDDPQVDYSVIHRYMDRFTRESKGEVLRRGQ